MTWTIVALILTCYGLTILNLVNVWLRHRHNQKSRRLQKQQQEQQQEQWHERWQAFENMLPRNRA